MATPPFYIVLQARDISEARRFYGNTLGCREFDSTDDSVTFDLYGHHWVCVCNPALGKTGRVSAYYNSFDPSGLPIPRAGVILELRQWTELAERLLNNRVDFMIEPTMLSAGRRQEEALMVLLDPSGNGIAFRSFMDRGACALLEPAPSTTLP